MRLVFTLSLIFTLMSFTGTIAANRVLPIFELPMPSLPSSGDGRQVELRRTLKRLEYDLLKPEHCGNVGGRPYKCSKIAITGGESWLKEYMQRLGTIPAIGLAPYPAPLPNLETSSLIPSPGSYDINANLGSGGYEWVESSEVIDGVRVLENWKRKVGAREVFDCHLETCQMLVSAWSKTRKGRVSGVAVCTVLRLDDKYTPPVRCRYIAITLRLNGKRTTYIRAMTYYLTKIVSMAGRTDFSIDLEGSIDLAVFLREIGARLREKPFSAKVIVKDKNVVGSADYQYFEPLGMFAIFTISISAGGLGFVGEVSHPVIDVATTLYVSPRTSSANREWSMPSPPENGNFIRALRGALLRDLSPICSQTKVVAEGADSYRLICESVP